MKFTMLRLVYALMFLNMITMPAAKESWSTSEKIMADAPLQGNVTNPKGKCAYLVPWVDMAAGRFLKRRTASRLKIKEVLIKRLF